MPKLDAPDASSPSLALVRILAGAWVSQAVFVAAKLSIADLLKDGSKPVAALAAATASHGPSLYRVLRALASVGVFAETAPETFSLTPMAACLVSTAPGSLRDYAVMVGSEWSWRSWGEILHSVRTGRPAFEAVYGEPLFDYYAGHPDAAATSATGLASRSAAENSAIVAAYDFAGVETVIDIGGGQGALLRALLAADPQLRGTLFEMPHIIAAARPSFVAAPFAGRCDLVAGDFFAEVPEGGDIYLLKKVLHDWSDQEAGRILASCRRAMCGRSRLLVIDHIVPTGDEPSYAKLIDLLMLVLPGGRERTEAEHRALLSSAGFAVTRVIPVLSSLAILEAEPN